jgi:hypothetical protein
MWWQVWVRKLAAALQATQQQLLLQLLLMATTYSYLQLQMQIQHMRRDLALGCFHILQELQLQHR